MKRVRAVGIVLLLLAGMTAMSLAHTSSAGGTAEAGDAAPPTHPNTDQHTYIISIPGLSFIEIKYMQKVAFAGFRELLQHGQIGAMNIRTAESDIEDRYVSFGAGENTVVPTGISFASINMDALRQANQHTGYSPDIGFLGEQLKRHGIRRVAIGERMALLLMDQSGEVDQLVGEHEEKSQLKVVAMEWNGLEKLKMYDRRVQHLLQRLRPQDELWIISPQVQQGAKKQKQLLAPIVRYGAQLEPGLLVSATTHRLGVVSYKDVAPAILQRYGIQQNAHALANRGEGNAAGAGFTVAAADAAKGHHVAYLLKQIHVMSQVYQLRPQLLYPFVSYQVLVLFVSLGLYMWKKRLDSVWISVPLFSILSAPLLLLVLGFVAAWPPKMQVVCFLIGLLAVSSLLSKLPIRFALGGMGVLTALTLLLDGFTGGWLIKRSVLGYDAMIGARYYGIGNEYMGVLIGSAILAASVWLQNKTNTGYPLSKTSFVLPGLLFALILWFLSAPSLGTNAGGALSAAMVFGFFMLHSSLGQLKRKRTPWFWGTMLFICLGLGLLLLWTANSGIVFAASKQTSHIGRAFLLLRQGQFGEIAAIIERKLAMNVHLLEVSAWSKLLLAGIVVLAVLTFYSKTPMHRRWKYHYFFMLSGFIANMIGALTVLVFNDSGIVAASTLIVFVAVPMLLLKPEISGNAFHIKDSQSA